MPHIRREDRSKINHLNFHFRKLEKEEQLSIKQTEKINNKKAKINQTENRK